MVTLNEIAVKVGVSVATASRALNPFPSRGSYVSAATKRKILDIAQELGYSPNFSARSLSKGSSNSIGVVFGPNDGKIAGNGFGLEMLFGVQEMASKLHFTTSIVSGENWSQVLENIKMLAEGSRIKNFILLYSIQKDPIVAYLQENHLNYVVTGRPTDVHSKYVDNDNYLAGIEAARLLSESLGKKKVLVVSSDNGWSFEKDRINGFKNEEMAFSKIIYIELPFDVKTIRNKMSSLFKRDSDFDAVYATDDRLAFMVREEFANLYRKRITAVGFNWSDLSKIDSRDFYSFDTRPRQLGVAAVKLIFSNEHNKEMINQNNFTIVPFDIHVL
ncbi:LacI family DNA-binding transcriptional regulator [Oenococcus sicerae]|uniref:LacI family DNA-binding transcriptional regulator n=1 Tax=Oenococcus sicerae TaxID=2203724 RepID=A0AAJ1VM51_9LACO|nr:LacI family DNA-binding transcriptional regulator [Oenococcus sicerae]MDN6900188.1 LacI family DNA-binding transcriptional regulator [Oenococcus sicerae]